MKILLTANDALIGATLKAKLSVCGYEVVEADNSRQAWEHLQSEHAPQMAILDCTMAKMEGIEICRRARQDPRLEAVYLILLSLGNETEHVLEGLRAGADDCVLKPFDLEILQARINVGLRIVRLQTELLLQIREMERAAEDVQKLQGLLPICSYCKSIRDDNDYWHKVEQYIESCTSARFSHGICPECWDNVVEPEMQSFLESVLLPEEDGATPSEPQ